MFAGSRRIFISFEHHKRLFPSELLLVIICYCCVFVEGTRTSLSSLLQPTSCQTATAVPVTQLDIFKDTFGHFRLFCAVKTFICFMEKPDHLHPWSWRRKLVFYVKPSCFLALTRWFGRLNLTRGQGQLCDEREIKKLQYLESSVWAFLWFCRNVLCLHDWVEMHHTVNDLKLLNLVPAPEWMKPTFLFN